MKYGMPTSEMNSKIFAFSSQKHYVSIYVNNIDLIRKYKDKLGNAKLGKNSIRYLKMSDIKFNSQTNHFRNVQQISQFSNNKSVR